MGEIRVLQILDRFDGKRWHTNPQSVALVESNTWVMVRNADYPQAVPFVISRKEWDKLPLRSPGSSEGE